MAIRVTQNTMYDKMTSQMQKSLAAYMESNEQGSSQKKINRPSDDPAGTYRVLVTRNDISATTQYQSNVDTAKGWLSLADNVLGTQLSNSLTSLKALAEQASTGTYSAENRRQIADQARQIFGQMLNLSNTQYEGNSIFAGQRYDRNAFEEGLALTSADTNWDTAIQAGDYTIQGASSKSMMIQFTSTGTLDGGPQTFRWSNDGGTTWSTGTTAGRTLTANGVTVTMKNDMAVTAADISAGPGSKNGTLVYIRPTAVYQGDDNDPPPTMTVMGGPANLTTSAAGSFGGNVLLRMDNNANLSLTGSTVNYSYSTDSGSTWVAATGNILTTAEINGPREVHMHNAIYESLSRQDKALCLLRDLLEEEYTCLLDRDTDAVVSLEFSIQELIRQLAVEKTSVIRGLGGMRAMEYATALPDDMGVALREILQRIDTTEQSVARQASRNTNLSLALLDQSSRALQALTSQAMPPKAETYGRRGGMSTQRQTQAALISGRL